MELSNNSAFGVMKIVKCLNSIKTFNDIGGLLDKPHDRELSIDLLQEELSEYIDAMHVNDETEIKDALGDIMYLLWGTILKDKLEHEFWDILLEICKSNMSKFDDTRYDAELTQKKYKDQGIDTIIEYNEKYYLYINKRNDGKMLKSHKFKEPNLKTT